MVEERNTGHNINNQFYNNNNDNGNDNNNNNTTNTAGNGNNNIQIMKRSWQITTITTMIFFFVSYLIWTTIF